ncbi:MAG: hypothetical protein IPM41_03885 [Sphingomonadales bacterium]|nr:hypothetical protein [Sphingomonadales bacterium]
MELKLGNSANVQQGGERGSTDAAAESANAISRGGKNTDAAAGAANVPIPADAERIVPVEGRVQLPAGTRLDSIRIVGTDLVVTLPDGEVVVIADGALRMPQLVIGTITIPQANIAALIAGQEPEPAAGALQSSGGNFAPRPREYRRSVRIGRPFAADRFRTARRRRSRTHSRCGRQ